MSNFGRLLEKYIKRNKMSVKAASEYLGINRTTLQHMIAGDRSLKNIAAAEEVGRKLMLTTDEMKEFLDNYKISVMGENVYKRRQKVQNILSRMENVIPLNGADIPNAARNTAEPYASERTIAFYNKFELDKCIRAVLNSEINSRSEILLLAQPSEYLNTVIYSCTDKLPIGSVKQYFCMDNNFNADDPNESNLDILYDAFFLASVIENYEPFYYYDNIASHINSNSLLPYCLVTDNYAVTFDYDFSRGIFYSDPAAVGFYRDIMKKYERNSQLFFSRRSSAQSLMSFYGDSFEDSYHYHYHPCVMLAVSDDIIARRTICSPAERMAFLKFKKEVYPKCFTHKIYIFFNEAGLKEFMESGVVSDLPDYCYEKPDMRDRLSILQKMIEFTETGALTYRILKENIFDGKYSPTIDVADNFIKIDHRKKLFTISEQGLIYSFNDYFEYLSKSDMIYTKEETVAIMKKYLSE